MEEGQNPKNMETHNQNERNQFDMVQCIDIGKVTRTTTTMSTISEIDVAFSRLVNTPQEGFNLPKLEILTFNGYVLANCKFIKNF